MVSLVPSINDLRFRKTAGGALDIIAPDAIPCKDGQKTDHYEIFTGWYTDRKLLDIEYPHSPYSRAMPDTPPQSAFYTNNRCVTWIDCSNGTSRDISIDGLRAETSINKLTAVGADGSWASQPVPMSDYIVSSSNTPGAGYFYRLPPSVFLSVVSNDNFNNSIVDPDLTTAEYRNGFSFDAWIKMGATPNNFLLMNRSPTLRSQTSGMWYDFFWRIVETGKAIGSFYPAGRISSVRQPMRLKVPNEDGDSRLLTEQDWKTLSDQWTHVCFSFDTNKNTVATYFHGPNGYFRIEDDINVGNTVVLDPSQLPNTRWDILRGLGLVLGGMYDNTNGQWNPPLSVKNFRIYDYPLVKSRGGGMANWFGVNNIYNNEVKQFQPDTIRMKLVGLHEDGNGNLGQITCWTTRATGFNVMTSPTDDGNGWKSTIHIPRQLSASGPNYTGYHTFTGLSADGENDNNNLLFMGWASTSTATSADADFMFTSGADIVTTSETKFREASALYAVIPKKMLYFHKGATTSSYATNYNYGVAVRSMGGMDWVSPATYQGANIYGWTTDNTTSAKTSLSSARWNIGEILEKRDRMVKTLHTNGNSPLSLWPVYIKTTPGITCSNNSDSYWSGHADNPWRAQKENIHWDAPNFLSGYSGKAVATFNLSLSVNVQNGASNVSSKVYYKYVKGGQPYTGYVVSGHIDSTPQLFTSSFVLPDNTIELSDLTFTLSSHCDLGGDDDSAQLNVLTVSYSTPPITVYY